MILFLNFGQKDATNTFSYQAGSSGTPSYTGCIGQGICMAPDGREFLVHVLFKMNISMKMKFVVAAVRQWQMTEKCPIFATGAEFKGKAT